MLFRGFVFSLTLLAGVLLSSPAFAQDWATTFDAEAVNSHVAEDGLKFVVVAAGEADATTELAAKALEDALRAGSAALVMNDDPLGTVKGLDDDQVLAKAKALPVDQVAIVRVFPGGEGKPATVVVTVRDKAGEAVWALSGTSGSAIEAKEQQVAGGMGVSRKASKAVGEVTESETKSSDEAREEYAKRVVWFQSMIGVNQYGNVVSSWSNAYKGKYRERLEPEEFYREVGRPDLAKEYASNTNQAAWAGLIGTVGFLSALGGGTWWMVEGLSGSYDDSADTTLPMVITLSGVGMMITGVIIAPDEIHPVSSSEALEMADKHNQKLKKELGLAKDYSPLPRADNQSLKYNFGIGATPGGAAGVLRVEF
jgi:hypothetical protein